MSRRDTIIVAVLINTGLLAVLFMMAIHVDQPEALKPLGEEIVFEGESIPETRLEDSKPTQIAARDELDQVLKNYTDSFVAPKPEPVKSLPLKQEAPKFIEVTVKRGDYLDKIAKAHKTSAATIIRVNQLANEKIDVGQVLRIPLEEEKPVKIAAEPKRRAQIAESEPEYYTMKAGDNPWKIAREFHVRFEDLLRLNHLDEEKARNLKPGAVLRVK